MRSDRHSISGHVSAVHVTSGVGSSISHLPTETTLMPSYADQVDDASPVAIPSDRECRVSPPVEY